MDLRERAARADSTAEHAYDAAQDSRDDGLAAVALAVLAVFQELRLHRPTPVRDPLMAAAEAKQRAALRVIERQEAT
jgi:hypothetical protein